MHTFYEQKVFMWQKIARLILRRKIYLIIGIVLVTAFLGYEALHIRMDYGYARMLSEDDEVYLQNKKFKELFGDEANAIAIGINDSLLLTNYEHFDKFRNFSKQINAHKDVRTTFGPLEAINLRKAVVKDENGKQRSVFEPVKIFNDSISSQAQLDSARNVFLNLPFYTDFLYNGKDTSVFLFTITLEPEILNNSQRQQSVAEIEDILTKYSEDAGIDVHISGHPYIRTEITNLIKRELLIFTLLAAFVCILILYLFFRSFKIIFASLILVALSLVWVFGYMVLFDYQVTILTSMIPPLLIVIGIPNIIYMFNKYHSEYKQHGQKVKALHRTICKIGNASFVTNLTTACGFATFIVTSNTLLIEFGVVASLGIMTVFLLSLQIIPIFFSLSKPPSVKATKHIDNKFITGIIAKIENIVTYKRKAVYITFIAVATVMLAGIFLIDRAGYILDDVPDDSSLCKDTRFLEENFGGVSPIEIVVIAKDSLNDQDYIDQIVSLDSLQQRLKKYPELSRSISIADAMKFLYQSLKSGNNYELPPTPDTYSSIMKRMPDMKGVGLAKSFIDSTRTATRVSMNIRDVGCDRIEELLPLLKKDIDEVFPAEKYETIVTGNTIMNYTGTTYLTKNLFISLALAILVIALFLFIMFRSAKVTLLSLIPNLIPMIVTAGVMGYFGIPIKPSTILVFSIAFGISVDDTIHYLAKYSQELKHTNGNIGQSVRNALSETGMSMIYTSIILVLGFGMFTISDYGGSCSMGILVSTALFVAMFSNIILLPSLLMTLEHHFNKKVFKEQFIQIYNEEDEIDLDELKLEEYDEDK